MCIFIDFCKLEMKYSICTNQKNNGYQLHLKNGTNAERLFSSKENVLRDKRRRGFNKNNLIKYDIFNIKIMLI